MSLFQRALKYISLFQKYIKKKLQGPSMGLGEHVKRYYFQGNTGTKPTFVGIGLHATLGNSGFIQGGVTG